MPCSHSWTEPPECPQCVLIERDELEAARFEHECELKKQAETFESVRERLKQLEIALAQAKEEGQRIWEQVSAENAVLKEANSRANKLLESQANENDKLVADLNSQLESAIKDSFDARQQVQRYESALCKIAHPALGGKQQQRIAQEALKPEK